MNIFAKNDSYHPLPVGGPVILDSASQNNDCGSHK